MQGEQRGYVVQESISQGQVISNSFIEQKTQIVDSNLKNQLKFQVPDQQLFQSNLVLLENKAWVKHDLAILTTKHFFKFPINAITKLKIKKQCDIAQHHIIKITLNQNQDHLFAIRTQYCYQWFYKTFFAVMQHHQLHTDPNQEFINSCDGQILKKGQFLGGWETRFVLITANDGLMSYRDRKESPTLRIEATNELWSRFETINNTKWVVIKIWNGIIKEEFAVPVHRAIKWVKAFYSLLRL